jgi:hypothetical protein
MTRPFIAPHRNGVFSVFNWRILLGGAASAAILTAGVAAPAFAAPRASTPAPLNGITQGLSGSNASGIFCALPNLPASLGVSAAAGALGESCNSTQVNGQSQSFITGPQASAPEAAGQSNGPARVTSANSASAANGAPSTSGASNAVSGLNSISNAIPSLGNTASVTPDLGNAGGSPNGNGGGLGSVTGTLSGVTGGLSGGGQAGGPATGPLP